MKKEALPSTLIVSTAKLLSVPSEFPILEWLYYKLLKHCPLTTVAWAHATCQFTKRKSAWPVSLFQPIHRLDPGLCAGGSLPAGVLSTVCWPTTFFQRRQFWIEKVFFLREIRLVKTISSWQFIFWCSDRHSSSVHGAQATTNNAPVATQVAAQHQQNIQSYECHKAITHHHLSHSPATSYM